MQIFSLVGNIAIEGVQSAESSMNSLGNSLSNLGNTISQIGNSLVNSISKPLLSLIGTGVKYRATIEDLETQFGVLLNSQTKAAKLMKDIREISRTTPFETENLAEAASTMLTYGISNEKVLPTLMKLGDVAMGNNEHFKMLTYNMSQVAAAGKLQGMDLKSLVLAGWNPLRTIMETTGETMDEVKQRMSDGAVSYEEVEKALIKVTNEGGRFHDGMAKGSLTLNGRISTLKDTFMEFAAEISKPIFEKIKEIVPKVTDVLDGLAKKFNSLDKDSKNAVLGIGLFIAAFPLLIILVGGIITGLGLFTSVLATLVTPIGLVTTAIGLLIGGAALGGIPGILASIKFANLEKLLEGFEKMKSKAQDIWDYLANQWKPAIDYILTGDEKELKKINDEGFKQSLIDLRKSLEDTGKKIDKFAKDVQKSFQEINSDDLDEVSTNLAAILKLCVDIGGVIIDVTMAMNDLAKSTITLKNNWDLFWGRGTEQQRMRQELENTSRAVDLLKDKVKDIKVKLKATTDEDTKASLQYSLDYYEGKLDEAIKSKEKMEKTYKKKYKVSADVDTQDVTNKLNQVELSVKDKIAKELKGNKKIIITGDLLNEGIQKKIDDHNSEIKTKVSAGVIANKSVKIDASVDDSVAKLKVDMSNTQIKTKSKETIPNVMKMWGTDAIINDMPAKAKTDASNSLIKNKALEIIPNVTKYWQTDSSINDSPAKSKADKSNKDIKSKADEKIPNVTKNFSIFADVDVSGALSSIGKAFGKLTAKVKETNIGSMIASIRIPGFAEGVRNYTGGLAMVGEKGPELVNLPKGSDVYTANETRKMLDTPKGLNQGSSTNIFNITVDAKNIKDFNDVINVFSRIKTEKITRLGVI